MRRTPSHSHAAAAGALSVAGFLALCLLSACAHAPRERGAAVVATGEPTLGRPLVAGEDLIAGREAESLTHIRGLAYAGRLMEARTQCEELTGAILDPAIEVETHRELAELLLRTGKPGRAAALLANLPPSSGTAGEWRARFMAGAASVAAGDTASARAALLAAAEGARVQLLTTPAEGRVELTTARVAALRWAGLFAARQSDYPAARAAWEAALGELAHPRMRSGSGAREADSIRLAIAVAWFAESRWDSLLSVSERSGGDRDDPIWDLMLGRAAFATDDFSRADSLLARITDATAALPASWVDEALLLRGWMASRRGEPGRALESYRRVGERAQARTPLRRYGEAVADLQAGDIEAAETLLAPGAPDDVPIALRGIWDYALAYARVRLGRYDAALEALDALSDASLPDSIGRASAMLRGDLFYRRGEMQSASDLYGELAGRYDDVPEPLYRRQALAALGAGRWGAAARTLGELLVKFPGTARGAEYNFWRGEALYRLGRIDEAQAQYRRAERLGSDVASCAMALGWCASDAGDPAGALAEFARASRACGGCRLQDDIALGRGYNLARLGRVDEAGRLFEQILENDASPDAAGALDGLGAPDRRGAPGGPGMSIATTPPDSSAIDRYSRASALFASLSAAEGASQLGARALLWEGEALWRAGALREAAERFERMEQQGGASDTLRALGQLAYGRVRAQQGDPGAALTALRAALAANVLDAPQRAAARRTLLACELAQCDTLIARGKPAEALSLCEELSAGAPAEGGSRDALRFLSARCREGLGETRVAAQAFFELADAADPVLRAEALRRAAVLFGRAGDDRGALEACRRRLTLDLDPAQAAETRALMAATYERLGERSEAANEWERIANGGPEVPYSLRAAGNYALGRIAFDAADWDFAARALANADSLGYGGDARSLSREALRRAAAGGNDSDRAPAPAPGRDR
jgi:tetratricopeptide (TPR) repeat protein